MPWTTTRAFFVRRTANSGAPRFELHRKFGGLLDRLRGVAANGPEDFLRRGFVHALDPCDDRDLRLHLLESLFHTGRDRVRLRDPAKDIHQDHRRARLDEELEGLFDFRRIIGPSEIQKYAALSAFQIQRVERRHRETGAIRDHSDVAVQLDEHDPLLVGLLLQGRAVLVEVRVFRMPVFGVVVDHELRVTRYDAPVPRHDERVDFHKLGVLRSEKIVPAAGNRCDLFTDLLVQSEASPEGSDHVWLQTDHGGNVFHVEVLPRHILYVHAAHRGRHQERLARGPVDRESQVKFLRDVEPLLQVHLLHAVPVDLHAEYLARDPARFVQGLRRSDSAGFPAATHEYLGLHHAGEGRVDDVLRPRSQDAARDRDSVAGEDLFRLVFEELHRGPPRR